MLQRCVQLIEIVVMGIQRARFKDFSKVVEHYKSKTIDHLRHIRPKWTFPKDSESMLNSALKPEENEYSIFIVNVNELLYCTR